MTSPKSARPKGERFTAFGWSFMLLFKFYFPSFLGMSGMVMSDNEFKQRK